MRHMRTTMSNRYHQHSSVRSDGEVIEKGQSCVPSIMESTRQNIDTGNDNSAVTIASIEEMLIAAVQERPPLWNYKDFSASQRTKAIKDKLWQEIEDLLNTNKEKKQYTIAALKSKWKNLYDTYRTYLMKEKGKSGQAAKKSKPWRFMEQMSFLKDTFDLGIKNTVSNLTLPTPTPEDTSFNNNLHSELGNLHTSSEDNELNKGNKKRKADDPIERIAKALNEPIPPPQILQQPLLPMPEIKEKDEICSFCLTMDRKLRKLPLKKVNMAMFKMYELLFKIENEDNFM
ncbi:uncharacterized protein [Temnothorax longispinosus]|uniref:uncharacterized protein isoform X2 n=1 Tax=Temnothorax longispinosus TaxID=300112 RepID=UPI003A98EC2A